jgi:tRNA (adenine58-N1)-methyltransferase non-catalytic subunit
MTKEFLEEFNHDEEDVAEGKDNRDISINEQGTAQKMSQDEILSLKANTAGASEIIKALQENSTSWDKRTKFSQEKWLKKKIAKYQVVFTIRKPNSYSLCEAYHLTGPQKICHLRPDSFGYLLNMANVNCMSHCLVVENTKGLVTGALCERMCAYTMVVNFTNEDQQASLKP